MRKSVNKIAFNEAHVKRMKKSEFIAQFKDVYSDVNLGEIYDRIVGKKSRDHAVPALTPPEFPEDRITDTSLISFKKKEDDSSGVNDESPETEYPGGGD